MTNIKVSHLTLIAALALCGCGSRSAGDSSKFDGYELVDKLCKQQGKYAVNRDETADGVIISESTDRNYLGYYAAILFSNTGLSYLELSTNRPRTFYDESVRIRGAERTRSLYSKSYIHVFLTDAHNNDCIALETTLSPEELEPLIKRNWCIAAIPIDSPTAEYRTESTMTRPVPSHSELKRFSDGIYNIGTNAPISEAVNFVYAPEFQQTRSPAGAACFKEKDFSAYGLLVNTLSNHKSPTYRFLHDG